MLQAKDDLLHRQTPFTDDARRVEQHETPHQAQHEVAIIGVFAVHLTRLGRQQMLQNPKDKLDPMTPTPPANQYRPAQRRL